MLPLHLNKLSLAKELTVAESNIESDMQTPITERAYVIHWPAIFSGMFISMLVYFTLMSLGLGFGGGQAMQAIEGRDSASGLTIGAGIWLAVTVLISLFVGSYATSRVSGAIAPRVAYVQSAVVSALFFTLMVSQAGIALGVFGRGANAVASNLSGMAGQAAASPRLNAIVEDALGQTDLRSSPETVVSGILSRLMRGDEQGAVTYMSIQTGMTEEEAAGRYQELRAQLQNTMQTAGTEAARAARTAGFIGFFTMLLGTLAAMAGGHTGASLSLGTVSGGGVKRMRPAYT